MSFCQCHSANVILPMPFCQCHSANTIQPMPFFQWNFPNPILPMPFSQYHSPNAILPMLFCQCRSANVILTMPSFKMSLCQLSLSYTSKHHTRIGKYTRLRRKHLPGQNTLAYFYEIMLNVASLTHLLRNITDS